MEESIYYAKIYTVSLVSSLLVLLIVLFLYAKLATPICSTPWTGWICTNTLLNIITHAAVFLGTFYVAYKLALTYIPKSTKKLVINGKEVKSVNN